MAIFSIFSNLPLPATPSFKRPKDLVYASDEKPHGLTLFTLSVQHIATALAMIAYVLAADQIGGLDLESTPSLVNTTMLSIAASASLQYWARQLVSGLLRGSV